MNDGDGKCESGRLRRLLFIDHSQELFLALGWALQVTHPIPMCVEWVSDTHAARDAMSKCRHDAYLLGSTLAYGDALDLLRAGAASRCMAPIIFLTEGDGTLDKIATDLGAAACLPRSTMTSGLISRTIEQAIERASRGELRAPPTEES
jgi:DNA-binding response OmpR family regulator